MAFPTSGLSNNQVHKEGNRAFVYDSALGVWDQVRETDRTENKILSGEIGSAVTGNPTLNLTSATFPAGHIRYLASSAFQSNNGISADQYLTPALSTGTFTAGSRILVQCQIGSVYRVTDNTNGYGYGNICGVSSSTGTASHSGLGDTSGGTRVFWEFGYHAEAGTEGRGGIELLVTPTNGCIEASYRLYYDLMTTQTMYFYGCKMMLWEVF